MSVKKYREALLDARLGEKDRKWVPRWLLRYADVAPAEDGKLMVTKELVEQFLDEETGSRLVLKRPRFSAQSIYSISAAVREDSAG